MATAVAALLLLGGTDALAQDESGEDAGPVVVSGSATITGDIYDYSSRGGVPTGARRPPSLFRLIVTPTVTIAGTVSLPFTIMLSSRETSTITPPVQNQSVAQFLQNAANSFGVSPKIGWAQVHLGSHTPRFSELTIGDVQLFGVGVDLTPGDFRVAGSAGIAQRAVEVDTAAMTRGAYARHLYTASVGYSAGESEVMLNVVRARDDLASIREVRVPTIIVPDSSNLALRDTVYNRSPLMPLPEEGFVTTISARVPIVDGFSVAAEIGGSLFTRDMAARPMTEAAEPIDAVMVPRISTRADVAGKLALDARGEIWGLRLTGLYIGPGYVTLGYPYLQADRLEVSAAPSLRLFDDRLSLSGSIGHQTNNLAQTSGATTTRILASANVDAQITEPLSLNLSYSNFGITTDVTNDTFRVRSIAQSFSVTPTYSIPTDAAVHTITATFGLDNYDDLNPITGAQSSNRTQSLLGTYALSLTAIPLTADLTGTYLTNALPTGDLTVQSVSMGFGYRLWEGAVTPSLTATYSRSRIGAATDDTQLGLRLSTTWRIMPKLRFTLSASTSRYEYGSAHAGGSFDEALIRTSLSWQL